MFSVAEAEADATPGFGSVSASGIHSMDMHNLISDLRNEKTQTLDNKGILL